MDISVDKVDEIMDNLQETLADHQDIESALMTDVSILDSFDDQQLENELQLLTGETTSDKLIEQLNTLKVSSHEPEIEVIENKTAILS